MDALNADSSPAPDLHPGKRASKLILIAQADEAIRASLQKVLQGAGYHVTAVAEAQDLADCSGRRDPDLLLLDLGLPGEFLGHVLKWLPSRKRSLPVICMTTMPEKLKPGLAKSLGSVLELPVEVPVLLNRIEDVITRQ